MGEPCLELEATEDALIAEAGIGTGTGCEVELLLKVVCTCPGPGRARRSWAESADIVWSTLEGAIVCWDSVLLDIMTVSSHSTGMRSEQETKEP